jgi:hypothetical protein
MKHSPATNENPVKLEPWPNLPEILIEWAFLVFALFASGLLALRHFVELGYLASLDHPVFKEDVIPLFDVWLSFTILFSGFLFIFYHQWYLGWKLGKLDSRLDFVLETMEKIKVNLSSTGSARAKLKRIERILQQGGKRFEPPQPGRTVS